MSVPFRVLIPARYASTRLPGKMLLDIGGRPLLQHVYDSAAASGAEQVVIATDDDRIRECAAAFGADVIMTSDQHQSGTDRLAEAARRLALPDDAIIVNLQGDEYGMSAALPGQVAGAVAEHGECAMATLCEPLADPADLHNPNVVKVVFDQDRHALYFSRAPIPWDTTGSSPCQPWRHIGLYAHSCAFLQHYAELPRCALERSESLEQLRVLFHGHRIHVQPAAAECGIGIDTAADLERARELHAAGS